MSRPSQEQIDEMVAESRRELTSGQLFLARAPVIVALADDLKAAREELAELEIVGKEALGAMERQRDDARVELATLGAAGLKLLADGDALQAENDAMAALLGDAGGVIRLGRGASAWIKRHEEWLAARAKRMGG